MQATAQNGLTRGTVRSAGGGKAVLGVDDTNYELHVECQDGLTVGQRVRGTVTVRATKVWTVAAGGSFITPLVGVPRMIQGRVKSVDGKRLIVQAGTPVCVELPQERSSLDLKNGELVPGVMVNMGVLPGARFEVAEK